MKQKGASMARFSLFPKREIVILYIEKNLIQNYIHIIFNDLSYKEFLMFVRPFLYRVFEYEYENRKINKNIY